MANSANLIAKKRGIIIGSSHVVSSGYRRKFTPTLPFGDHISSIRIEGNSGGFFYLAPGRSRPQHSKTGGILRGEFRKGGMIVFICEAGETL